MEQVRKNLEARRRYLLQVKKEKEKSLVMAPDGALRICCHEKRTQYYQRRNSEDINGVYIREKDMQIAQKLAQKDYDKKVLRAAEKELGAINKFLADYPAVNTEQIYEKLHKERQKLIIPTLESDSQYIERWENVEYQGKEFYGDIPEFYSAKGERVRSKSELIIADILYREGIPYRYEYPILLKGLGTVHPDFTVLNVRQRKEIYWEHMGMMDDVTYAENAIQKIAGYEQNGIFQGEKLILTYETKKTPINQKLIMMLIQQYLY